jgi:hypothetical protein
VAQERGVQTAPLRAAESGRAAEPFRSGRTRAQSPLALRAAEEYAYVTRDVRRILVVGGAMIATMAVCFVLIDVLKVISV